MPVTPATLPCSTDVSVAVGTPAADARKALLPRAIPSDNGQYMLKIAGAGLTEYGHMPAARFHVRPRRATTRGRRLAARKGVDARAEARVGTGDLAGAMALAEGEPSGVTNFGGSA
jgi:hypothetical protein